MACMLCDSSEGELLWQDDFCRAVLVDDPHYPGFCRVILNRHLKEMTDLSERERSRLMEVVFAVEQAVRELVQPDKINLASLGNVTPHVHWHVIPRFADDRHFPNPIWAEAKREGVQRQFGQLKQQLAMKIAAALNS
jgi:diadenosine tetraphosphate (Ap4A) HIT family hydrolase